MLGRSAAGALLVSGVLALTGCSGSSSSSPSGSSGGTSSSPGSASPSDVVAGVKLTAQGTKLQVGQTARVSWQPNQKKTGVAAIKVTRLQKVPISTFRDWQLDPTVQASTPYFVHATVRNLGRTNLSGVPVPLYLLERNTLLQASTFRAQFAPCPSGTLPKGFTHGKQAKVCLVYFVPHHGKLAAISFRPTQDFDAITWRGPVQH